MRGRAARSRTKKRRTYGTGSLVLRGKTWWIQIRTNGSRYRESTKTQDEDEARRLLKQRLGEEASNGLVTPDRVTISDLCDLVIQDYHLHQRKDVEHVVYRSDRYIRPLIGKVPGAKFRSEHQEQYIAARRSKGASDSTINRELAIIRRGFRLAMRREPPLLVRAPFIEKLQEGAPREDFSKTSNMLYSGTSCQPT